MPNREKITIATLYGETEDEIEVAQAGEQVRIRVRGVEEEDILPGFVLCAPKRPVHCVGKFEAQIVFLDLRSIISAGYNCVLHVHSMTEEVSELLPISRLAVADIPQLLARCCIPCRRVRTGNPRSHPLSRRRVCR